jgi:hypothetical protein
MEENFLSKMKEIFRSLEEGYQPTAQLVEQQRCTIEKLECELGMLERSSSNLVQVN